MQLNSLFFVLNEFHDESPHVAKGFKEKTSVMQIVSECRMKHNAEKLWSI